MVTGVGAKKHNIQNFTVDGVPYTSNSRQAFALWEILPRYGLRSAFHYWWASWPAEEVDGLIVSDRFLEIELSERVAPEDKLSELDAVGDAARFDATTVESLIGGFPDSSFAQRHERKIDVLDKILERDEVATALGLSALKGNYDLVATYLRAPDAVGHKFFMWHFHDRHPTLARWLYGDPDADQATLAPLADLVYQVIDEQLGRLIEAAGDDVNIMIVSDHGMTVSVPSRKSTKDEPETGGHHPSGVVLLAGPDIRGGASIRGATVYDVLPTLLYLLDLPVPDDMPGRVLSEAIGDELRANRKLAYSAPLGSRDSGDPTPIPTGDDEAYLEQLRALGYVVD
jgi:predicted AlkP superfamily phosphohydrolase/phosphomutase